MDFVSGFLIYVTLFRLATIATGAVCIVLGYRLFSAAIQAGNSSVDARLPGFRVNLKNAAPGTCFALFGAIMVTVMVIQGGPELTLQTLHKASGVGTGAADSISLKVRGQDSNSLAAAFQRGKLYYDQGDKSKALSEFEQAAGTMAQPLNSIAWLYMERGNTADALPLARLAVQICPNNADFLDTLSEVLVRTGQKHESISVLEKAYKLQPDKYGDKLQRIKRSEK